MVSTEFAVNPGMMTKLLKSRCLVGLLTPVLLVVLGGCPGGIDEEVTRRDPGANDESKSDNSTDPWASQQDGTVLPPDGGVFPDMMMPDTAPPAPDTAAQPPPEDPPPMSGVGGPCPCTDGLLCVEGSCRAICNAPTDACMTVSNCPADHACLGTTAGVSACVPATSQPGGPCSLETWCPVNHVCGAVEDTNYTCKPICANPGGPCGAGGTCVEALGCTFCSV